MCLLPKTKAPAMYGAYFYLACQLYKGTCIGFTQAQQVRGSYINLNMLKTGMKEKKPATKETK